MECKLIKTVGFPTHNVFGQIEATNCDKDVLMEGAVDFEKVQPILFVMNDRSYWKLGTRFAKAWKRWKKLDR
jgi:flavin reductase (DIM6/NTAB) family NADH-FMN oxidoreductase RutF